ncbi:MAG: TrmH family RNA methyltransferase [Candidatus ainarchaeum sp.]|nr:TrmH family RNA methyltransferase [Candidatus ainarchaeum sp.]
MKTTVIFVEPEYARNIGYVCRVMANFNQKKLVIVNPKCEISGDAVKYSKHGKEILKNAKVVDDFEKEIVKYDFIVGSTAILRRNKGTIRDVLPLKGFVKNIGEYRGKNIALLLGREGIGLNENEINNCDVLVSIESSNKYPTLNVSHALAVILYSISNRKIKNPERIAERGEREMIMKLFKKMAQKSKNPKLAEISFRRIIGRARIKKKEAVMIIEVLKNNS